MPVVMRLKRLRPKALAQRRMSLASTGRNRLHPAQVTRGGRPSERPLSLEPLRKEGYGRRRRPRHARGMGSLTGQVPDRVRYTEWGHGCLIDPFVHEGFLRDVGRHPRLRLSMLHAGRTRGSFPSQPPSSRGRLPASVAGLSVQNNRGKTGSRDSAPRGGYALRPTPRANLRLGFQSVAFANHPHGRFFMMRLSGEVRIAGGTDGRGRVEVVKTFMKSRKLMYNISPPRVKARSRPNRTGYFIIRGITWRIEMSRANLDFLDQLPRVEEVGTAIACFQCGACVADCSAAAHSARFNPPGHHA